jgi:hypothetical protein
MDRSFSRQFRSPNLPTGENALKIQSELKKVEKVEKVDSAAERYSNTGKRIDLSFSWAVPAVRNLCTSLLQSHPTV